MSENFETRADRFTRVPWAAVVVFTVTALGLAWLVALPLWNMDLSTPTASALASAFTVAMMFTPAIAVLVVCLLMKAPRRDRLRLLGVWPLRPARRVVWAIVAMLVVPLVLVCACLGISALFGWVTLDLVHFSGFQSLLNDQLSALDPAAAALAAETMPPVTLLVAVQVAVIPFAALINAIPAFGEEIGWRGWLLPALRPWGLWPALLISGAIWGLWHAPVILLGHNFGRTDVTGVLLMLVGCVIWGVFFGWLRLRTGSVWPAVVGHASLNASGGLVLIAAAADTPTNLALINPLGVSGWIVLALIIGALAVSGQFRREPELAGRRIRMSETPPS